MKIFEQFVKELVQQEEEPQGFSSEEQITAIPENIRKITNIVAPRESFSFDKITEISEYERRRSVINLNL